MSIRHLRALPYLFLAVICALPALNIDANYTMGRFAHNLAIGRGLIFYSPAPVITTYPLIPIAFTPFLHDPLWVAWAISGLAAAAGGLILPRLSGQGRGLGLLFFLRPDP